MNAILADKLIDIADMIESGKKVDMLVSAIVPGSTDKDKFSEIAIAACEAQHFGIFIATMVANLYEKSKNDTDELAMALLSFLSTLRMQGVDFGVVKKIAGMTSELMKDNVKLRVSMVCALQSIADHQAEQHADLLKAFDYDPTPVVTENITSKVVDAVVAKAPAKKKTSNKTVVKTKSTQPKAAAKKPVAKKK
jgi:hypothetical protein